MVVTATAMKMNQITSSVSVIVNFPPCVDVTTDRKPGGLAPLRHRRDRSSRLQNAAARRKRQWVRSADKCVACLPTYGSGDDADPLNGTRHVRTARQRPSHRSRQAASCRRVETSSPREWPTSAIPISQEFAAEWMSRRPTGSAPADQRHLSSTIQRGPRKERTMSLVVHKVNKRSSRSPSSQGMESPATSRWNRVDR
jgi:hypothetical protein